MTDSTGDREDPGLRGIWYFLVTALSFGMLSWVPFMHAATRLGSRLRAVQASVYGALSTLAIVLFAIAPVDANDDPIGVGSAEITTSVFLLIGMMGTGCAQQVALRRESYGHRPAHLARAAAPDPAIDAVLTARARRAKARKIAASDPLMARELRIGRPDLPRTYDDGGLVDLNNASARAIAKTCEVPADVAQAIVAARTAVGGFLAVDDVFGLTEIPLVMWSVIRDRGVVFTT